MSGRGQKQGAGPSSGGGGQGRRGKDANAAGGGSGGGVTTASGGGGGAMDQAEEEPLVAVVLADSYDNHFAPLTLNMPRCLLPLANVPLLHYSIESATRAGVSHIYVLSRAHVQLIRQHVREYLEDLLHGQGIAITVMSLPEARSEGDALRELDAKQVLRSDFLLYRSDSVCTVDLRPLVEQHRKRRTVDKDAMMTMCCMHVGDKTPMRSRAMRQVQYVDPSTNQVLHYEMLPARPKRRAMMPLELLCLDGKSGCEEIDVRFDLVDTGVYVCSVNVPPLFSENFDYQSLSHDFIPGILTSDLLEDKIFLHIAKDGYGGRAQDTQTYDAISRDVLRRWTHPFTPASSGWLGERMAERRGWRYVGQDVRSDRTSNVGSCSMIAARCVLEPQVSVVGSVVCEDVRLGQGSEIVNSHIHPSATIGAQVKMTSCIIGRNAQILDNVTLGRGCLIGADCVVGPNVSLPDGSRVGSKTQDAWDEDEDDEEDTSVIDAAATVPHDPALGTSSRGALWTNLWRKRTVAHSSSDDEDDDEEEEGEEDVANLRLRAIGYTDVNTPLHDVADDESVSSIEYDSELDDEDGYDGDSTVSDHLTHQGGVGVETNLTLDDEADTQLEQQANERRLVEFESEARASLQRALEENHSVDNALLELKTLRMASNVALSDVQRIVLHVLLERCRADRPKEIQALIVRWGGLIAQVSSDDERLTVLTVQSYCAQHAASHGALFVPLLKLFYNEDVVSDEAIIAWWRSRDSQTDDKMVELRTKAAGVVRYILEDEDDDDDEDEEDDE